MKRNKYSIQQKCPSASQTIEDAWLPVVGFSANLLSLSKDNQYETRGWSILVSL